MADYRSLIAQARQMRTLASESQADVLARNRARYSAYLWLATQPTGQVLLDDWCLELLKPCLTPEDEGARRFILKVFQAIVEAPRVLGEEDGYGA